MRHLKTSKRVFVDLRWLASATGRPLGNLRRVATRGASLHPIRPLGPGSLRLVPAADLPDEAQARLAATLAGLALPEGVTIIVRGQADQARVVVVEGAP